MERGPSECELDATLLPASGAAVAPGGALDPAQRARRAVARTVLRLAAPLEPRLLERFGKHSPAIQRARAWKKRLRSETSPVEEATGSGGPAPAPPAASPPQLPFGVNLAGYVRGEFGVAEMARASAAALAAVGVPHVLIEARTHVHRHLDPRVTAVSDANPFGINLIHVNADQVHAFREQRGPGFFQDRRNIGVWFWEVEPFPSRWPDAFRALDEIWVASRHVHTIVSRASPIPVVHVPFPLHVAATPLPLERARYGIPGDAFAFLFHFDFLSELERKNPLGAVRAFQRAFAGGEPVALVVKSINSEHAPEALARLREAIGGDARIVHLDGHVTRDELLSLVAGCDGYLSLHRAEGLGLGLAEALSFGKPVVATGYSGNLDFMTPSNSFLVGYELVTLDHDHGPYAAGSRWAEPDLGHAAELLRMVVRYPDLGHARGARGARELAAEWSAARAGRAMLERLRLVAPDLAIVEAHADTP
ncbi:MAG: glycosyltransferase [Deltaproteobacteria bacterium]|nr:glycosyltransferase [Deltaproteobacteria bacterium]